MYRGVNHTALGQEILGEDITITVTTSFTEDFDDDEPIRNTSTLNIRAQLRDLSKKERELFETKYDTNQMFAFYVKKDTSINPDDHFIRDNKSFTIIQVQEGLSYLLFFAIYEERL